MLIETHHEGGYWDFKKQWYSSDNNDNKAKIDLLHDIICMGAERVNDENGKNLHSTQKPLKVLNKIIQIASNPNDVVLDCFCGVGSTGVSALQLGRKFIGIECDKRYINATERRLNSSSFGSLIKETLSKRDDKPQIVAEGEQKSYVAR